MDRIHYFIIITLLYIFIYNSVFIMKEKKDRFKGLIKAIMVSLIIGIATSFLGIILNIYVYVNLELLIIIPIAIVIYKVAPRYLCLSYIGPILIVTHYILKFPKELDIRGLIGIVGLLHLAESMFILTLSEENVSYEINNANKFVASIQGFWLLPISMLLIINSHLKYIIDRNIQNVFLVAQNETMYKLLFTLSIFFISYSLQITLTSKAILKKKMKVFIWTTGIELFIYSLTLIFIYESSYIVEPMLYIGILVMPIMHELLIVKEKMQVRT